MEEKETNEVNTEALFAFFDRDKSGTIDADEFQDLAYAAGIPLNDASAKEAFLNLQVSNPEYLTLEEFNMFLSGSSDGSRAPVSRLLRARLLANQLGRSLHQATESSFWKEHDDRVNSLSCGIRVGEALPNTVPMEINVSSRPADTTLDGPKISLVLNIEDGVSDFTLGTAIGTLQTMFDAAVASSGGGLPVSIKVNDPVERKLIIDVVFNNNGENKLPKGPPIDLNVPDVLHAFEMSLKFGQCFETLFGEDSKIIVFGDSFSVDFSGKIEIVKKGLRLLKHIKMNMARLPHRYHSKSFIATLMEATVPFLFPLMLDVANIEFEFDNVTEFLNALSKNDRGLNVDKALLEWIRRIQGWHIATMLTLPPRTGLSREMPASAKKLYETMKSTFSGLDSITFDMGTFNNNKEKSETTTGIHGLAVDMKFINFNPFRILPTLDCEHYGHQSGGTYKQVCDEWFATFKDPVLRTWAAIVQKKPLPKDFLVSGAIDDIMKSKDSDTLIRSLIALRDLALDGALVDQMELMKHVKKKRLQVGDAMWNKNVARSFGDVLQAVRSRN